MHRCRPPSRAGRRGSCRSASAPRSRSPGAHLVTSHEREQRRPGSRGRRPAGARRPGRRSSRRGGARRRRRSGAGSATGRPRRRTRRRSSAGTSKVTATASSVSRSTAATVRVWNAASRSGALGGRGHQISLTCSNGSRQSRAAVERLAGGRRRTPRSARRRPSRTAGRSARGGSGSSVSATGPPRPRRRPGRRDAVLGAARRGRAR